ncbi:hypothetical protein JHS3_08540 [Jeongeupia sp. HS-3]|nr:hypothetical protein JHS3_08540 [Jeongeupia sp. HS-3]
MAEYAEVQGLSWVDDDSNDDQRFTRNFLRHAILPGLVLRDPGVHASLARLAGHAAEAEALLGELAEQDLGVCVLGGGFDLAEAARLGVRRSRNALRHWLSAQGIVADARAFEAFINQLDSPDDAQPQLRWRGETIRRYRGRLYRVVAAGGGPVADVVPGEVLAFENGAGRLVWQSAPDGVSRDKAQAGCWQLRPRQGGERLRLRIDGPNRPLKLLYQEAGVPPWLRETTPLLYCDDALIAVPGIGVAAEFRGEGWLPLWQPA